jgi:hypothetical protein
VTTVQETQAGRYFHCHRRHGKGTGVQDIATDGVIAALEHSSRPGWLAERDEGTGETILSAPVNYTNSALPDVAKQFPLRLAAALREIIGRQAEVKRLLSAGTRSSPALR